jgi:hypothetical protein
MNKEFVSFQIAYDMKSLGFDEPCQSGWYLPHSEIAIKAGVEPHTWQLIPTHPLLNQIAAPTFSQCFRWFREKCQLDSSIALVANGYGFYIHKNRNYTNKGESYGMYIAYEEAELECLKKLIEIVKDGTKINTRED